MTEKCPHFGQATPDGFDCSGCAVVDRCFQKWEEAYDTAVESCLSGLTTYKEANEQLEKLGCEVPNV